MSWQCDSPGSANTLMSQTSLSQSLVSSRNYNISRLGFQKLIWRGDCWTNLVIQLTAIISAADYNLGCTSSPTLIHECSSMCSFSVSISYLSSMPKRIFPCEYHKDEKVKMKKRKDLWLHPKIFLSRERKSNIVQWRDHWCLPSVSCTMLMWPKVPLIYALHLLHSLCWSSDNDCSHRLTGQASHNIIANGQGLNLKSIIRWTKIDFFPKLVSHPNYSSLSHTE